MPVKATQQRQKRAPKWATEPFHHYIEEAERLYHLVRLSSAGISMIRARPQAVRALMMADGQDPKEETAELKAAEADAELAKREVESGFPILHAWAVVGLWALLEATIRTFLSEWLKHKRVAWRAEPIQKLKITLGEYESIPKNQRHHFVVEMLEEVQQARLRYGVKRFEVMLDPFDLSEPLPGRLKREIFELAQVRNLIVHNAAKVDRRFADACPWLDVQIGHELHISHQMFQRYSTMTMAYATLIICRVAEKFGVDMSDPRRSILEDIEQPFSELVDKSSS